MMSVWLWDKLIQFANTGGSTSLSFLTQSTGIPIDQVNFIVCQLVALFLSVILKQWVKKAETRLWYCLLCGVYISYFCFGSQVGHIIVMGGLCFSIIHQYHSQNMPWLVLVISMTYMSFLHLRRQFFDAGNYSLDITGPMMVLTQKVTSLGFSVRDGYEQKKSDDKAKESSELQRTYEVQKKPSFLEFTSFTFQFQSMLAGPLVMYKDFIDFIYRESVPSSLTVVLRKIIASVFFAVIFITVGPHFQASSLIDEEFLNHSSWMYKVLYITVVTTLERTKYHHAWILADAVCNASGLGYDEKKKTWDLTTNVRPFDFECGLNMKESLDHWNIGTGKWLRYIIYERVHPRIRTVLTYLVSAMWHGFFPGYYITFLTGALFTSSARTIRRHIRPYFLQSREAKIFYDVLTWIITRIALGYCTFTFMLLDFTPCIVVFTKLYFFLHILPAIAIFAVPPVTKYFPGSAASQKPRNSAPIPPKTETSVNEPDDPDRIKAVPSSHTESNGNDSVQPVDQIKSAAVHEFNVGGDESSEAPKMNGVNNSGSPLSSVKLKTG